MAGGWRCAWPRAPPLRWQLAQSCTAAPAPATQACCQHAAGGPFLPHPAALLQRRLAWRKAPSQQQQQQQQQQR